MLNSKRYELRPTPGQDPTRIKELVKRLNIIISFIKSGLSLRARGRGFSPVTKRVAPGYFYWKIEEK